MRNPLVLALPPSALALACTGSDRSSAPPTSVAAGRAPAFDAPSVPATPPSKMTRVVIPDGVDDDAAHAGTNAAHPAAAEAPYDLAADRERRARVAKEELGPRTITTVVSDIFVVIGPPGWQGGSFEQSVSLMRSSMAGYMNNRFGKKPAQAISVYLFPEAPDLRVVLQEEVRGAMHRALRLLSTG